MADKILTSFLERQLADGTALAESSDILSLHPLGFGGRPPQRYFAEYDAAGLVQDGRGEIVPADGFHMGIRLDDEYLRHVYPGRVLTYLGPHRRPWHANIRPPLICVEIQPGMPLVELLYTGYEIWTWQLYYTGDEGLNHAAAQWARRQDDGRFPIDARPLKRPVAAGTSGSHMGVRE